MSRRPYFAPCKDTVGYKGFMSPEFGLHGGFALSQQQKNVSALHDAVRYAHGPETRILEVLTRSLEPLGKSLSAHNLILPEGVLRGVAGHLYRVYVRETNFWVLPWHPRDRNCADSVVSRAGTWRHPRSQRDGAMKFGALLHLFCLASYGFAGGITWEYEQFCERRPAYSSQEDSPVATFRVSVMRPTLPVGFADQQALLERFIGSYLTIPSYQVHWGRDPFRYGETIPEAVRSLCDEWYEYYAGEAEAALAGGPVPIFLSGWFIRLEGRVCYLDERCLVYRVERSEYEGGVHPSTWYRYLVWSFEKKRPLWLDEILDMKRGDEILEIVRWSAAVSSGYTDYGEYCDAEFVFIDRMPQNFALCDDGLVFIYNDYEASGYRGAPVEICVGWEALRPFVKDTGLIPRLPVYRQAVEDRPPVLKNTLKIGNLLFGKAEDGRAKRGE